MLNGCKAKEIAASGPSKATVDAIVEATTQLLLEGGYDRFTTARVAERAGVSIGSLYQYFPNKAALASAVIDRCCENFLVAFESTLADAGGATFAECIRAIIDRTLVSHPLAPELHRIVLDLAPRIGVADKTEMVSRAIVKLIKSVLRMHVDEIAPEIDLGTAAVIIETVLEAMAHRIKLADPANEQNDTLAKEATRLITHYLAGSSDIPLLATGLNRIDH